MAEELHKEALLKVLSMRCLTPVGSKENVHAPYPKCANLVAMIAKRQIQIGMSLRV